VICRQAGGSGFGCSGIRIRLIAEVIWSFSLDERVASQSETMTAAVVANAENQGAKEFINFQSQVCRSGIGFCLLGERRKRSEVKDTLRWSDGIVKVNFACGGIAWARLTIMSGRA
jgi:hypothetical protein